MQRTVGAAAYNDKKSKRLSIYKNRHTQPPLRERHGLSKNIAASAFQQSVSLTFHGQTLAGQALAAINLEFPHPPPTRARISGITAKAHPRHARWILRSFSANCFQTSRRSRKACESDFQKQKNPFHFNKLRTIKIRISIIVFIRTGTPPKAPDFPQPGNW
jgi:hypothetical protein